MDRKMVLVPGRGGGADNVTAVMSRFAAEWMLRRITLGHKVKH